MPSPPKIRGTAMKKIVLLLIVVFLLPAASSLAENYVLEGQMGSDIVYELQQQVTKGPGTRKMVLSFVVPPTFTSPTYKQDIRGFKLAFSPEPNEEKQTADQRGNQIITATWNPPPSEVIARISFRARNHTDLQKLQTGIPFPLSKVPADISPYLKATAQVQSDDQRVRKLAKELTDGVTTQFDAVQRIPG